MGNVTRFLTIQNVSKQYGKNGAGFLALSNITLDIDEHEFVSIVGKSGCGKTTLLRMIAGLVSCEDGVISLQGHRVEGPASERGLVFQEYVLFPWRSVSENVAFGLEMKGVPSKQRAELVAHFVSLVGLNGFESAFPSELSGGMRQRVAIAAVLANDPKVLLMDEPFGALDSQTRSLMQELLLGIWEKAHKTVLFITHDIEEALFLADHVYVMTARPGRIKQQIDVDIPRPRTLETLTQPAFVALKRRILGLMHEEAIKAATAMPSAVSN